MWSRTSRACRVELRPACSRRPPRRARRGRPRAAPWRRRRRSCRRRASRRDRAAGGAVVVALGRLVDEVAVLDHPGELDDALELHLAPAAADLRARAARSRGCRSRGERLLRLARRPASSGGIAETSSCRRFPRAPAPAPRSARACRGSAGAAFRRARAASSSSPERVARERLQVLLPLLVAAPDERELRPGAAIAPRAQSQSSARAQRASPTSSADHDVRAMRARMTIEPPNGRDPIGRNRAKPHRGTKKSAPASPKTHRS